MKSLQQLLDKVDEEPEESASVFDFDTNDLLQFVPWSEAQDYLKCTVTNEEWEIYFRPLNKGNVIGCMEDYMKIAWEICLNTSGLSSCRTLAHYKAWLWIIEDQETIDFLDNADNYPCFGAPILKYICGKYNWDPVDFIEKHDRVIYRHFIKGKGC